MLLVKEPCKGDVGKPSMGLHRPYRALLIADLHNLGLTPQAILCRPFRAPEKCTHDVLCKGCHGNEHTEVPPTLRTHVEHETRWSACSQENVENHSVKLDADQKHDGTLKPPDRLLHNCLE